MNAFNRIAEPALFVQQLYAHSLSIRQSVAMTQPLTEALLAEDHERVWAVHEQICRITDEVGQIKLSLYAQIKNMHFHPTGGYAISQYLACQDKVANSAQEFADLLVLRKTAIPIELHADFRAFVSHVVNVSRGATCLMQGLSPEAQTLCADTELGGLPDPVREVCDGKGQARRLRRKFTRRVYSLEEQLDPVAIMLLDNCCAVLHQVADNAEHAADYLCLMVR